MNNKKNIQKNTNYNSNTEFEALNSPFRGQGGKSSGFGGSNVIVGIGEILWDMLPNGKVLGGAPANFAYHVSQFGFEGYAVSAIGSDELGDEIVSCLSKKKTLKYSLAYPLMMKLSLLPMMESLA